MGEKQHYDHAFSRFLIKMKNIHSERMRRGWFKWLHWVRAIAHAFNDGGHGTSSAPTTQESICLLSMQSLHGNIVRLPIHTRRHVGHSGTRQTYSTSHWCECDAAVRAWRAPRMKNGPFPISKSISIYFLISLRLLFCAIDTSLMSTQSTTQLSFSPSHSFYSNLWLINRREMRASPGI